MQMKDGLVSPCNFILQPRKQWSVEFMSLKWTCAFSSISMNKYQNEKCNYWYDLHTYTLVVSLTEVWNWKEKKNIIFHLHHPIKIEKKNVKHSDEIYLFNFIDLMTVLLFFFFRLQKKKEKRKSKNNMTVFVLHSWFEKLLNRVTNECNILWEKTQMN